MDTDKYWLTYLVCAFSLLLLYVVKAALLLRPEAPERAPAYFTAAVAVCTLGLWAVSDDHKQWYPVAVYLGGPVTILTVPCISFLIDYFRLRAGRRGRWLWRVPLELVLAVPLWFILWAKIMTALGWSRIR